MTITNRHLCRQTAENLTAIGRPCSQSQVWIMKLKSDPKEKMIQTSITERNRTEKSIHRCADCTKVQHTTTLQR